MAGPIVVGVDGSEKDAFQEEARAAQERMRDRMRDLRPWCGQ
jgi:hypothetical protein